MTPTVVRARDADAIIAAMQTRFRRRYWLRHPVRGLMHPHLVDVATPIRRARLAKLQAKAMHREPLWGQMLGLVICALSTLAVLMTVASFL